METLQQKVHTALLDDPRTKKAAIEVLDNNGVITLSGIVPNANTSNAAESIVEEVSGVSSVINEIQVKADRDSDFDVSGTLNEDVIVK